MAGKQLPEMPEPYYLVLGMHLGHPNLKLKKRHRFWFSTTVESTWVYGEGQRNLPDIENYGTIDFYAKSWTRRIKKDRELKNWYESWHNG